MDDATALARLERMTQAATYPALASEELLELLELARRHDTAGVAPNAPGWAGVYDLNAAAAEGWRWKAGKVAGDESVNADGASFAADTYKGCLAMAAQYDRAPNFAGDDPGAASGSSYGEVPMLSPNRVGALGPNDVANLAEPLDLGGG